MFHYYSYFKSFRKFDKLKLSVSCLFLAAKIKGTFIKIETLKVFYERYSLNRKGTIDSDAILNYELELLNFLGFDIEIETAFSHIHKYLRAIEHTSSNSLSLYNIVFNLITDSYRRPFCIAFKAKYICLACVYLASRINHSESKNGCISDGKTDNGTSAEGSLRKWLSSVEPNGDFNDFDLCLNEIVGLFHSKLQ